MLTRCITTGLLTLVALSPAMYAQDSPQLPKVLRIIREDIKQGRRAAHEKQELGYVRAFTRAKFPTYYLAMSALTGSNSVWFLEGHDTFASIEQTDAAVEKNPTLMSELDTLDTNDGELRSDTRTWIAVLRPDLSYRIDELAKSMPMYRNVSVSVLRAKFGHDREFGDVAKQVVANYQKANDDRAFAMYQVASGALSGTYLVFVPMRSMTQIDEASNKSKAMREAVGEDAMRDLMKQVTEHLNGSDTLLFALKPAMSYAPKEYAQANPEFWGTKAKAPASAKPGAPAAKSTTGQ